MKKILLIVLLMKSFLFAHNEYFKINESNYLEATTTLSEALTWSNYIALTVNNDFPWYSYPPWFTQLQTKFDEALIAWNSSVIGVHIAQEHPEGTHTFFTDVTAYFSDPVTQAGIATSCVANNHFVNSCTISDAQVIDPILLVRVTQSRVVFNNTSSFGYVWSDEDDVSSEELSFKYVAMHEFGHILGLAHCTVYQSSIMWSPLHLGNGNEIINTDKDGLSNLIAQSPVTQMVTNTFRSRQHYFFQYDPEVLFYINSNKGKSSKSNFSRSTENKLVISPKP
jgi:Matrixin